MGGGGGGRELGVEIIDCKNDSISVALPFNKELYNSVFLVARTSRSDFGVKILNHCFLPQNFLSRRILPNFNLNVTFMT